MTRLISPPVFCDNCSSLAMAEVEGARLCAGCVLSAVFSSRDPSILDRILPLELSAGVRDPVETGSIAEIY